MREHMGLFRGKRTDNGEWVYWDIFGRFTTPGGKIKKVTIKKAAGESYYYHAYQLSNIINKDTVGECTGLRDKNGKLIFEGDILRLDGKDLPSWFDRGQKCEVKYSLGGFDPLCDYDSDCGTFVSAKYCEIIGNIHDNPELLEE